MRCGGSILSYCPHNPHGKAGNEERRITFTQMHTTIFVRFLKWARIVGHLSCPFAISLLNHSLFPLKSCTDVFKPVIIDQPLDNLLFGTSHFFPYLQNLFILCLLHYLLLEVYVISDFFFSRTKEIEIWLCAEPALSSDNLSSK